MKKQISKIKMNQIWIMDQYNRKMMQNQTQYNKQYYVRNMRKWYVEFIYNQLEEVQETNNIVN